uniref:EF-hand domain-containing protein n=1 Tax=Gallus gallus TaxID=9031 RepID=A0A8V0XCE6_CHICK
SNIIPSKEEKRGMKGTLSCGNSLHSFFSPLLQKQDTFSLDNVIKLLDKNNDGSISFDEFVMLIKKITGQ